MRCPACDAENGDAKTCAACGEALTARRRPPRSRALAAEADTPFSPYAHPRHRAAHRAYKVSVYGLIPPLGLVLGPLAVVLALVARYRARSDPEFAAHRSVRAALVLGGLLALTQWAGLVLMVLGLRGTGG